MVIAQGQIPNINLYREMQESKSRIEQVRTPETKLAKKILTITAALDLDLPYGLTPATWQTLKAFYELGCENIVVPYRGKAVRSLWWKTYDNPCYLEGEIAYKLTQIMPKPKKAKKQTGEGWMPKIARAFTTPKWKEYITEIIDKEPDIEVVYFVQIPLNQIRGLAKYIKKNYDIPCVYFEADVPTSLPENGGFSFSHFIGSDVTEFDSFIIGSEGSADRLYEMGVNDVFISHFAVDPDVFKPVNSVKTTDVFFSGKGGKGREKAITELMVEPSKKLDAKFMVSGGGYDFPLGKVKSIPGMPFSSWRYHVAASKINLNIARGEHAMTYATSTSRPFELAAMKSCIISCEYNGLENWFDLKNEMLVAHDADEATELYNWLLHDDEERNRLTINAYNRVINEHTFQHRCTKILEHIDRLS